MDRKWVLKWAWNYETKTDKTDHCDLKVIIFIYKVVKISQEQKDLDASEYLYGTGDYVQLRRDNGLLYYEGRCDSQVKVRGHRVDLSEIEKAVVCLQGVDKAVILCYKPNEAAQKVLCFFTSNEKEV